MHLDKLGQASGVRAFSVHPGSILTPLQRHVPREEQIENGWIDEDGNSAGRFKTPEQGAATQVWAATSPQLADMGGLYCEDCDIAEVAGDEGTALVRRPGTGAARGARLRDRPGAGRTAVSLLGGAHRRQRVRLSENGAGRTGRGRP